MSQSRNKKIFLLGLFLGFFFGGLVLTAAAVWAQAPDMGLSQVSSTLGLPSTDIRTIIANIIRIFLGLLGIIALVLMIYAGFVWMTSGGSEEKIGEAKKILTNATVGLVIILSAYAIVSFVITRLLSATTGYPQHCFDGVMNQDPGDGETGKDCGGTCPTCGGGGSCTTPPCGFSNVFYVDSLPSSPNVCIRNVKLAIVFSEAVDITTLNDSTVTIQKKSGPIVSGSWSLGNRGNIALWTPSGSCSPADGGSDCLEATTTYVLDINDAVATGESGIRNASGSRGLNCISHATCKSVEFTTGEGVDRNPPTVRLDVISPWQSGSVMQAKIRFTDDNGLQNASLYAGDYFIGSKGISGCQKSGSTTIDWATAGMMGNYLTKGVGMDWAGNQAETSTVVILRPSHCFNHTQDAADNETGIDCGVGSGCGLCANGKCLADADCASGFCYKNPATAAEGVCMEKLKITAVSPLTGAVGDYVTISGNYFGENKGKIYFVGSSGVNLYNDSGFESVYTGFYNSTTSGATYAISSGDGAIVPYAGSAMIKFSKTISTGRNLIAKQLSNNLVLDKKYVWSIYARGANGGEILSVMMSQYGQYYNFVSNSWGSFASCGIDATDCYKKIILTNQWAQYSIDITSIANTKIIAYFGVSSDVPVQNNIYVDNLNIVEASSLVEAQLANCGANSRTWSPWQIVVEVPNGALVSGPIRVDAATSDVRPADLRTDATNNGWGPTINDFSIGGLSHPGLCPIDPDNGVPNDSVNLRGKNFGTVGGSIYFGDRKAARTSWTDPLVRTVVPGLDKGSVGVYLDPDDKPESNSVYFYVGDAAGSNDPVISEISPRVGSPGEYITIIGNKFGTTQGRVWFQNGVTTTLNGDNVFPVACSGVTWNDKQIIIKFPSSTSPVFGDYSVWITTGDNPSRIGSKAGQKFTLEAGVPAPGICKIDPSSGPVPFVAGRYMSVFGEYFSYNTTRSPDLDGLLAFWNFDSTDKKDLISQTAYTCTGAGCPVSTSTAVGGSALQFADNGTNSSTFISPVAIVNHDFSFEFWSKFTTGLGTTSTMLSRDSSSTFELIRNVDGSLLWSAGTLGVGIFSLPVTATLINQGSWNHFVCTYVSTTRKLTFFVNKELVYAYDFPSWNSLVFYKAYFTNAGLIDNVAIYNKALTWQEIKRHYDNRGLDLSTGANTVPDVYFWKTGASSTAPNDRVVAVQVSSIAPNLITLRPPTTTQSGPVAVYRSSDRKLGNSTQFEVNDCIKSGCTVAGTHCCGVGSSDQGICRPDGELCAGEVRFTGYAWRFSTRDIPVPLTVIEKCDSEVDTGRALPSPSPSTMWNRAGFSNDYHSNVCRGALVEIEFSRGDVTSSLAVGDVLVSECEPNSIDLTNRFCNPKVTTVDVKDQSGNTGSGVSKFHPQLSSRVGANSGRHYLELTPDGSSDNNGKWKDNTWYRVVLKNGISAGAGTSTVNLLATKPCDVNNNGKLDDNAAYCFLFKTGSEDCRLSKVIITPYRYWTNYLEEPLRDHLPNGDVYDLYYSGHGLSDQRCIMMNVAGYDWQWSTSNTEYADIYSNSTNIKNVQVSSLQNTVGVSLDNEAVNINVRVATGTLVYGNQSPLTIDLSNPKVTGFWPNCLETCTDAYIGAQFNITMSNKNVSIAPSGPIQLLKCGDENCSSTTAVDLRTVAFDPTANNAVLKITPSTTLDPRTIYQVVLSNEYNPAPVRTSSAAVYSDVLWSAARYDNLSTFSKPFNQEFVWRFRTKKEACKIDRVEVLPKVFNAPNLTAKMIYSAQPYSAPDACSASGQKLNAASADWRWNSSDTAVATTTQFVSKGYNPFCTAGCVRKGSDVPAGVFNRNLRVCGNGVVEAGEDCDPGTAASPIGPNKDFGCGLNCLRLGNTNVTTTAVVGVDLGLCGDGVVSSTRGEECDMRSAATSTRLGCTANCLHAGSAFLTGSQDTLASICGNSYIGAGEDCDLGVDANPVSPTSSVGCSTNCLHQGTRLSTKWCEDNKVGMGGFTTSSYRAYCSQAYSQCGDGVSNPDEDPGCDAGAGLAAVGCNEYCLLKVGDYVSSTNPNIDDITADNACPATGVMPDGNGCSSDTRQHMGSSLLYSVPSICGDGIAGLGEDAWCETNLTVVKTDEFVNPWALATGIGNGVATGNPATQRSNITATTRTKTSGDLPKTGSGEFVIKCGFNDDDECKNVGGYPISYGVANDSCCRLRSSLVEVYPGVTTTANIGVSAEATNICPNTYISARFDQMIDSRTLPTNFIIARGTASSVCDILAGEVDVTSQVKISMNGNAAPLKWYASLWHKVVYFFKNLVGSDVQAVAGANVVRWCAGQDIGNAEVLKDTYGNGSKIKVNLKKPLAFSTDYAIILGSEIKDTRGVKIGKVGGKDMFWRFSTGAKICEVDQVTVSPNQYYFSTAGSTTTLEAEAWNAGKQHIQSIPGSYAWDILWSPQVNNFVGLVNTTSTVNIATAQNQNGEIDIRASASITDNQDAGVKGLVATGRSHIIVFLCERPWPPKDLVVSGFHNIIFPYEDKVGNNDGYSVASNTFTGFPIVASPVVAPAPGYFNFATYYCADNGSTSEFDDLPYLRPTVQVSTTLVSVTSSLKRFLFTNERNSDAIGVQVFPNQEHLTVRQWFMNSKTFGGQEFTGNLQSLKVSGYDAVSDGNNIYVDALDISSAYSNPIQGHLYTNIYLFSINSDAKPETRNVYDQIIKNLKFNTNLTNYRYCGPSIGSPGATTTCSTDFDCPKNEVCSAQTDKIKRNYQRLRDLSSIEKLLSGYNTKNNSYPNLAEGSYLTGQTLSTWPSWSVLGTAVNFSLATDPINKLAPAGSCSSSTGKYCLSDDDCTLATDGTCLLHDAATGWSTADRRFSFACNSSSLAYRYIFSTSTGYKVYSKFESTGLFILDYQPFLMEFITSTSRTRFSIFDGAPNDSGSICRPNEKITTMQSGRCGDGKLNLNLNEQCDPPGYREYESTCTSGATPLRRLKICKDDCSDWTPSTTPCVSFSKCGNNKMEPGETCDDGVLNGKYNHCNADCKGWGGGGYCGNGSLQAEYEACDTVLQGDGTLLCTFSGLAVSQLKKDQIFYFLIDQSGSMTAPRLNSTKAELIKVAEFFDQKAKMGIATYFGEDSSPSTTEILALGYHTKEEVSNLVNSLVTKCTNPPPPAYDFTPCSSPGRPIGFAVKYLSDNVFSKISGPAYKNLVLISANGWENTGGPTALSSISDLKGNFSVPTYILINDDSPSDKGKLTSWALAGGTDNYIKFNLSGTGTLSDKVKNFYISDPCLPYSFNRNQSCKYDCSGFGGYCGDGHLDNVYGEQCEADQICSVGGESGNKKCDGCLKKDGLAIGKWLFDEVSVLASQSRFVSELNSLYVFCDSASCPILAPSVRGNGLSFNGSNTFAYSQSNVKLDSDKFSISVWVKPTGDNSAYARIVEKGGINSLSGFGLEYRPEIASVKTNKVRLAVWKIAPFTIDSTSDVSTNTWTHIVGTYESGVSKIYINGILENTRTGVQMSTSTRGITIGRSALVTEGNYFNGLIDELAFYNHALSEAEVKDLYDTNWLCVASTTHGSSIVTPTTATCGNGKTDQLNDKGIKEECDNGSSQNGIACQNGYNKSCSYCSADCSAVVFRQATGYCGDGIVTSTEVCDVDPTNNIMYAASTSAGVSGSLDAAHNGYPVELCANELNTKINASSTYWALTDPLAYLLTHKKGTKTCIDNCHAIQNDCVECGLNSSGTKVGGYIMNVLEPDSKKPLYNSGTYEAKIDLFYTNYLLPTLFADELTASKYRVAYDYNYTSNDFNKYDLHPANPSSVNGQVNALINNNPVCSNNTYLLSDDPERYQMTINGNSNFFYRNNIPIVSNVLPGQYDLVLSPIVTSSTHIRIVVSWFGAQDLIGGFFTSVGNPMWEGPWLSFTTGTNYYIKNTLPEKGVWWHRAASVPSNTNAEAFTVDVSQMDADTYAFYVRAPDFPIKNLISTGKVKVEVYIGYNRSSLGARDFEESEAGGHKKVFYLNTAITSDNPQASYWHVFNIKKNGGSGPVSWSNIEDVFRDADDNEVQISRIRTSELQLNYSY